MNNPVTSKYSLIIAGLVYWAIISIIYSIILTSTLKNFNLSDVQITVDTIVNNVLILAACLLIFNNMRYYLPRQEKYWYVLMI
ncbi:MAG: hypothetical protein ABIY62_01210, partial [Ginsengibacter sp.]